MRKLFMAVPSVVGLLASFVVIPNDGSTHACRRLSEAEMKATRGAVNNLACNKQQCGRSNGQQDCVDHSPTSTSYWWNPTSRCGPATGSNCFNTISNINCSGTTSWSKLGCQGASTGSSNAAQVDGC
jgi:hypothetical protein